VGRFVDYEDSFNRDFFKYFLYSSYYKNEIEKLCSVALQPNVSAKQVESIIAYLPPKELQNKFSGVVDEVRKGSKSMAKAKRITLFESLSEKAFKGEL
jgi:type I restriction enzyme S subunit